MDPRFYAGLCDWSSALGLLFLTVMLARALSTGRVPNWALLVSFLLALPPGVLNYLVPAAGRYLSGGIGFAVIAFVAVIYMRQSIASSTAPAKPRRP